MKLSEHLSISDTEQYLIFHCIFSIGQVLKLENATDTKSSVIAGTVQEGVANEVTTVSSTDTNMFVTSDDQVSPLM